MANNHEFSAAPNIISAVYRPTDLPEHTGNPLIEALPPFHGASEMSDAFGQYPHIADSERNLPAAQRMLAISRLSSYLEPLPCHFEIMEKVSLLVRNGYVHRNPANESYHKQLVQFYREAMDGKICAINTTSPSTAPSFSLFGVSGVGKSTVMNRALSFLPQVLLHKERQFTQVVWLKLDCPLDGSLKHLLISILEQLDRLLGTTYYRSSKRTPTIDELILDVAKCAARHHLGVLVIDEIQHLLDSSGVGSAKMLNFFVTFANTVKIPFITVGTPRACNLLQGTFREARRVGDLGTIIWESMSKGDEWDFFVEGLWKYQWTSRYTELSDALKDALYNNTMGIHALVIRLFQLTQLEAIREGSEELTVKLFNEVALAKFKLVKPMLDALKTGSKRAIQQYEDLLITGINKLGKDVDDAAQLESLKVRAQVRNQGSVERMRTISALMAMGNEEAPVQKLVDALFESQPNLSSSAAVKILLDRMTESPDVNASDVPRLAEIVASGKANGMTPLQALKSVGVADPGMGGH